MKSKKMSKSIINKNTTLTIIQTNQIKGGFTATDDLAKWRKG